MVTNTELFKENYEEAKIIVGQFQIARPTNKELEQIGIKTMRLGEVPDDQRDKWSREVEFIKSSSIKERP